MKSKVLLNLFETQEEDISLSEMISHCTQLKIAPHDNRPPNICKKCIKNLNISYEFRQLAQESDEKFRQMALSQESDDKKQILIVVDVQPVEEMVDDCLENTLTSYKTSAELEEGELNVISDQKQSPEPSLFFLSPFEVVAVDSTEIGESKMPERQENVEAEKREMQKETENIKSSTKCEPNKNVDKRKSSTKKKIDKKSEKRLNTSNRIMRFGVNCWECYKCKSKFHSLNYLRRHLNDHRDATPNECMVCELHYSNRRFKRHLCTGKSIQCEYCSEELTSMDQLTRHLESDHKSQVIITKCNQIRCKKRFPMKLLLEWHLQLHSKQFMSFVCPVCNMGFSRVTSYDTHLKSHSDKPRKFTYFGKIFHSKPIKSYSGFFRFRISLR